MAHLPDPKYTPTLPIELYRLILSYLSSPNNIDDKEALINLSATSRAWQEEVERILWERVTLSDDNHTDKSKTPTDLISLPRLAALTNRLGKHVRHLTLRFHADTLDSIPLVASLPVELSSMTTTTRTTRKRESLEHEIPHHEQITNAIRAMKELQHLVLCHKTQIAIALFPLDVPSSLRPSILSIEDQGQLFPPLLASLLYQARPSLQSFTSTSSIIKLNPKPRHQLDTTSWPHLTTLLAHPSIAIPFLTSPHCHIRDLTIYLSLSSWFDTKKNPFVGVGCVKSVQVLRIGSEHGFERPLALDYIGTIIRCFPNIRDLRRVPFSETESSVGWLFEHIRPPEETNIAKLLTIIANSHNLTFLTLADHTVLNASLPPSQIAKTLKQACPRLKRILILSRPSSSLFSISFKEPQIVNSSSTVVLEPEPELEPESEDDIFRNLESWL